MIKKDYVTQAFRIAAPKGITRAQLTKVSVPALRAYLDARNNRRVNYVRYPATFEYNGRQIASMNPGCPAGFRKNSEHGLLCKPRAASFVRAAVIAHRVVSYENTPIITKTLTTDERVALEKHDQQIQNDLENIIARDKSAPMTAVVYQVAWTLFRDAVTAVMNTTSTGAYNAVMGLAQLIGKVLRYSWTGILTLASTLWNNRTSLSEVARFLYENVNVTRGLYRFAQHLSHLLCGLMGKLDDNKSLGRTFASMLRWYDRAAKGASKVMPEWSDFTKWFPNLKSMCTIMAQSYKTSFSAASGGIAGVVAGLIPVDAACGFAQTVTMHVIQYLMIRSKIQLFTNFTKLFDCTQHRVRDDEGAIAGMASELWHLGEFGHFITQVFWNRNKTKPQNVVPIVETNGLKNAQKPATNNTPKRATAKRATTKRATSKRATTKRATTKRTTTKRATTN